MATTRPPRFNPNAPIPNDPFAAPESNYIEGEYSPLIVGTGLSISPQGVISAIGGGGGGGVTSVSGISPISVALGTTTPTISVASASTASAGVVILNSAFNSTSTTTAATSSAVKAAYDVATAALPKSGGTMTGIITFAAGQTFPASGLPIATTLALGIVQVGTNIQVSASGVISVTSGSTTAPGVVQLADNLITPSSSLALTANQGLILQNQISALSTAGGLTLAGTINASTGNLVTVSSAGASASFTVGSPLPAAVSGNTDYFVIVTTAGSFTPPGGSLTAAIQGDWFLSNGSAWEYLAVGATATAATTTSAGIVELATNAEVATGTDTTRAVTPAGVASAYIACSSFSAKGNLLAGTGLGTFTALGVGTTGQALVANPGATSGLCWTTLTQCQGTVTSIVAAPTAFTGGTITTSGTINLATTGVTAGTYVNSTVTVDACGRVTSAVAGAAAIPCSVITAKGSLIVGASPNTPAALAVGLNGTVLTADSLCPGGVKWGAAGASGTVTSVVAGSGLSGGTITTSGTIALAPLIPSPAGTYAYPTITVDACGRVLTALAGATPVCTTAFTAKGQILVGSGSGTFVALPIGADNCVLMADSTCTTCGVKWGAVCQGTVTSVTASAPIAITGTATTVPNVCINPASTTACGAVQLYNGTNSDSVVLALTAAQGKNLQDQINGLAGAGGTTLAGTFNANLAQMVTVTTAGAAASFAVGSNLPAAAAGNSDYYVIVTTGGSYTPPGGSPVAASQGDWFLSSGTAWQYLNVGADPTAASTTTAGVVRLATTAETQTGTDATLAVTPAGAKATYIACTALTAKGAILTATAAGAPAALGVGGNCSVLMADSTCSSGLKWAAITQCQGTVTAVTGTLPIVSSGGATPVISVNSATPAARGVLFGTSGSAANAALGQNALCAVTSGVNNTAVGDGALCLTTGGNLNVAIGVCAGCGITTGSCNVLIGPFIQAPSPTGNCQLAIGYGNLSCWLTGDSTKAIRPGAGIRDCAGSTGTNGQVLMSNGSNAVCWGSTAAAAAATPLARGTVFACTTTYDAGNLCATVALGNCALGSLTTGDQNTAVGGGALKLLTTGRNNTALGNIAGGCVVTGDGNTLIGSYAAGFIESNCSTVVGSGAGQNLGVNDGNVFIGAGAGSPSAGFGSNLTNSVMIGLNAGYNIIDSVSDGSVLIGPNVGGDSGGSASNQFAIGAGLQRWITGNSNFDIKPGNGLLDCCGCPGTAGQVLTSIGNIAGLGNRLRWCSLPEAKPIVPNSPGVVWGCTTTTNTALGYGSINNAVTGIHNTVVGYNALPAVTSGCYNVSLGMEAGSNITTGCNNVAIGPQAKVASATGSCQLAIGFTTTCNWLTGDSNKHIRPGAGIRDCAGALGSAGQSLTSTGSAVVWATPTATAPGWTFIGSPVVGATTTAPNLAVGGYFGVWLRQVGVKIYQLQFIIEKAAGGTAGSGDYLITLPNGLSFETNPGIITWQRAYTGSIGSNWGANVKYVMPGPPGIITDGGSISNWFMPAVYDSTRYRMVAQLGGNYIAWGSGFYAGSSALTVSFGFQFVTT